MPSKAEVRQALAQNEVVTVLNTAHVDSLLATVLKTYSGWPLVKIVTTTLTKGKDSHKCIFTKEQNALLGEYTEQRFTRYMEAMWTERLLAVEPELKAKLERITYFDPGYAEAGYCECGQSIRYHFVYKGSKPKTRIARHLGTSKVMNIADNELLIGSDCIRTFMKIGSEAEAFILQGMKEVNKERAAVEKLMIAAKGEFEKWLRGFVWRAPEVFTKASDLGTQDIEIVNSYLKLGLPLPPVIDDKICSRCRALRYADVAYIGKYMDSARTVWKLVDRYYPTTLKTKLFDLARTIDSGKPTDEQRKKFRVFVARLSSSYATEAARLAKKLETTKTAFYKSECKKYDEIVAYGMENGFTESQLLFLRMLNNTYKPEEE